MIPCISRLVPANGQSFALLEDIYFAGGFRTLASVEEMQSTHVSARKAGMHVFVPGVGYFKLADDLITWLPDPFAKALTASDLYAMLEPMYIRQRLSRSADDQKVFLATRVFHSEAMQQLIETVANLSEDDLLGDELDTGTASTAELF
jgi:hypothetical protein